MSSPDAVPESPTPGDAAPAGVPGTAETLCRHCGGSGRIDGAACPDCKGIGKVTTGIDGG